jgi:D-alanyl-D-alanine carboxypeptidase/D-alanyl-D-alanine-endopeptidase (penicillin-binding protein 4)
MPIVLIFIISALSFDSILKQPELSNAYYGIYIRRLDNEKVLYNYNSNKLLIPASNMKLVTTAAALSLLGRDFRFKTRLGYLGTLDGAELDGDLVLIGGGDPTLGLDCLDRFCLSLKQRGITSINGNLAVVDNYFVDERLPVGWSWHYLDAKYAAEISALSINKNCVNVIMRPTAVGDLADVSFEPQTSYVKLVSQMRTKEGSDSIIIYRKPEANVIYVDGAVSIRRQRAIDVAVKDPALFTGVLLWEKLAALGIAVRGSVIRNNAFVLDSTPAIILDSAVSAPLDTIVQETNTESENLYAEILVKTMGAEKMKAGSFAGGISAVKKFLTSCNIETTQVSLWDGSGLSKHNLIAPIDIARVLQHMYHDSLFNYYYRSLASPGNGTLEYRFSGFRDSLHAKTGSIHAVSCLSGYLRVNGIDCCFSLMFNNYTCGLQKIMTIQEGIISALADYLRAQP